MLRPELAEGDAPAPKQRGADQVAADDTPGGSAGPIPSAQNVRRRPKLHQRVNLWKSHPGLHHSILTVGCMGVALALNFWLYRPTFNPYGVDKTIIGAVFAVIGVSQLMFLTLIRDLRMVRIMLAVSISWMMFWGLSNTQQFFAGNASLQLPILYIVISLLQVPLLIESPVNPFTEKK